MEIRLLKESDLTQCRSLFQRVFNVSISDRYLYWKYFQNPLRGQITAPSIVAVAHGEVVGMYASVPYRFDCLGQTLRAAQPVDNCIHPDYRRYKTQFKMFSLFADTATQAIDFIYGFPTAAHLKVGLRFLKYEVVTTSEMYTTPTHHSPLSAVARQQLTISSVATFDSLIDSLCKSATASQPFSAHREHAYLNWRYVEHPEHTFDRLELRENNRLVGLAICRTIPLSEYASTVLIYDLLLIEERLLLPATCALRAHFGHKGIQELRIFSGSGALHPKNLEQGGFELRPNHGRVVVYRPFSEPWISSGALRDSNLWGLSFGDSDA